VRKFLHDHSLSIGLGILYLLFKGGSWFTTPEDEFLYPTLHGHSDDVLGAFVIVVTSRWWYEKGSPVSKPT
jgi:hypothetical protein